MSLKTPTPFSLSLHDMVSVLAHDVKNPLASMVTNSEYLRDEAANDDTRAAAEDILAAAHWVNRMLSNLADLSHLATDASVTVEGPCDLSDAILGAKTSIDAHARDRGVQIDVHAQPSVRVAAEADMLLRMCETLLEACVRHTPKNTRVRLSAGVSGEAVEMTLVCGGTPLDERERRVVFLDEAFIGDNAKRLRLAPSFGLQFVHRAAAALGGSLSAEEVAVGLRLCLRLPVASQA